MLIDLLKKKSKGMPLVIDVDCDCCQKTTKHYFDDFECELTYECFICDRIRVVDSTMFFTSSNQRDDIVFET